MICPKFKKIRPNFGQKPAEIKKCPAEFRTKTGRNLKMPGRILEKIGRILKIFGRIPDENRPKFKNARPNSMQKLINSKLQIL